jgi:integrase
VLSDDELSAIWNALGDDDYGRIVKQLVLTGCRREEIGGMRCTEFAVPWRRRDRRGDAELRAALEADTRRGFGRNPTANTRLVQQLLAIRGFDPGEIDGLVGPRTRAAITAFLQAHGGCHMDALDAGLLTVLLGS